MEITDPEVFNSWILPIVKPMYVLLPTFLFLYVYIIYMLSDVWQTPNHLRGI